MQPKAPAPPPPPTITINDVYYVIFKHKWKILICSTLGLIGASLIYFLTNQPYTSEAKLLVRYVQDSRTLAEGTAKPIQLTPEAIMNGEANILTSLDVALAVVEAVGAEKVLGKGAANTNRNFAAQTLRQQLAVDVPARGNVLRVLLKHPDPDAAQPLLRALIDAYFRKHVDIHRNLGAIDDALQQQTDQAKARLTETEDSLRKILSDARITSVEEAKKQIGERMAKVAEELRQSEVDLEQRRAALGELQKAALLQASSGNAQTNVVDTNAVVAVAPQPKLPPDVVEGYKRLLGRLETFRQKEEQILQNFRPESALAKEAHQNVAELENQKREMEQANPRLLEQEPVLTARATASPAQKQDLFAQQMLEENARIAALVAKIKILSAQLESAKTQVVAVDKLDKEITPLQRKKDLEDTSYRYYSTNLDQARFSSSLSGGQLSNIKEIQAPSLPFRDSKVVAKNAIVTAVAGIVIGFALAFLLEFVLDQSIRKPSEVEQKYKIPNFLTIPEFVPDPSLPIRPMLKGPAASSAGASGEMGVPAVADTGERIPPWDESHKLHPYTEALRDRLMSFFEVKGLTHKPKLVALTSCSQGAGVTTLAAGLAASLSETGEGNVLLVDMNAEMGAAHPFFQGKPACGLSDVLQDDKRPAALVHENLYAVHGTLADDQFPALLPKRLRHLIPKLQASDYDYIIFDMPPITQTSVTPRLAGFMDMVFLVVEDGKTSRDWLKHASALLQESKANLGAVFNKRRTFVPKKLHQEF